MDQKIIIAKPCHESWNRMTAEEQGRHCAVCSKVVKDFTKMKTDDIIHTLKNTEGEVCGRIHVKELTPANKKQKVYFWINGVLFRKAIYPIMALLGVSFVTKKAEAQVGHDYPVKGKMDVRDYHTNTKKITVIVKSNDNQPVTNAEIFIVSGIKNHAEALITDANGMVSVNVAATDLTANEVEIEIRATGYEYKNVIVKVIKDIQTVEIKMEYEMIMMGEMMYVPEKIVKEPTAEKKDSIKKIEIIKCSILTIEKLPEINKDVEVINILKDIPVEDTEIIDEDVTIADPAIGRMGVESGFDLFPNPSTDVVNIVSSNQEIFNVDIFDGNGKKIHAIVNSNSRYNLDVSNYLAGVYYALITVDGKAVETKKIIVSR